MQTTTLPLRSLSGYVSRPTLIFPAVAAVLALLWGSTFVGLAALPLLAVLWRACPTRRICWLTFFAYYVVGCRGLFIGTAVFFSDPNAQPQWWSGLAACTLPPAALASAWAFAWGQRYHAMRMLGVLFVLALPPIGVFGWLSPIVSSGALFPGLGVSGLIVTILLLMTLATPQTRRTLYICAGCVFLSLITNARYVEPMAATQLVPINTSLPSASEFERMEYLRELVAATAQKSRPGALLVLPEAVAGDWEVTAPWWARVGQALAGKNQTLLLGGHQVMADGRQQNLVASIGQHDGILMPARMPVPISMWRPWADGSFVTNIAGKGVAVVGTLKVAYLICYEQLLGWPIVVSMLEQPDVVVGVSNSWWARGTNIPAIQVQHVRAWARLLGVPYVYAENI